MLKTVIIVVCLATTGVLVLADNALNLDKITDFKEHIDILNTTSNSTEIVGRKGGFSPFHYALPFHALWGFGGLHALGILFAIKFKIIIVAIIVAISVFYYTKYLAAKRCDDGGGIVKEGAIFPAIADHLFGHGGPMMPLGGIADGYSNHIPDISSYGSLDPYSGYHGFHHDISPGIHYDHSDHHDIHPSPHFDHHDILSSPHFDHHDIHSSPHFDHHDIHSSPHFDHSDHHDIHPDISSPPGNFEQGLQQAPDNHNMQDVSGESAAPTSLSTRRVSRGRSNGNNYIDLNMPKLGELAFQFLGVDTEGCRRRFICEFDFRTRNNPVMKLAYGFVSRSFFNSYRDLSNGDVIPEEFSDCARIFNDCKAAEKYSHIEQDYKEALDESAEDNEDFEGSGSLIENEYLEQSDEQKTESSDVAVQKSDSLESEGNNTVTQIVVRKDRQPSESVEIKKYILSRQRRF